MCPYTLKTYPPSPLDLEVRATPVGDRSNGLKAQPVVYQWTNVTGGGETSTR